MEVRLNQVELARADAFRARHTPVCPQQGVSYSFRFGQQSGIGTSISIECSCGIGENITDYEAW